MATVTFGNHSALRVRRAERQRIQSFYRDVLGCQLTRSFGDKDDFRIGDFHIAFIYASGSAASADKGTTYGAQDALADDDFMKAIFLELKTGDVEQMRKKITAFGVRVLDVSDPHLYFSGSRRTGVPVGRERRGSLKVRGH